jgi:hypothetical protein
MTYASFFPMNFSGLCYLISKPGISITLPISTYSYFYPVFNSWSLKKYKEYYFTELCTHPKIRSIFSILEAIPGDDSTFSQG